MPVKCDGRVLMERWQGGGGRSRLPLFNNHLSSILLRTSAFSPLRDTVDMADVTQDQVNDILGLTPSSEDNIVCTVLPPMPSATDNSMSGLSGWF